MRIRLHNDKTPLKYRILFVVLTILAAFFFPAFIGNDADPELGQRFCVFGWCR